jgi:hypothetical protein
MPLKTAKTLGIALLLCGSALAQRGTAQMLNPGYGTQGAPMSNFINDSYLLNDQLDKGPSGNPGTSSPNGGSDDEPSSSNSSSSASVVSSLARLFKSVPPEQVPLVADRVRQSVMSSPEFVNASPAQKQQMLQYLSSLIEAAKEEADIAEESESEE